MPKQNPHSPPSVFGKIAAILSQFTTERPSLTLTEIAGQTGISKPTVFRLLKEMIELGYITQSSHNYQLGLAVFRLGMVARQQIGLDQVLNTLLRSLADKTGETIITATLSQQQLLYLHVIESDNPLRFVLGAGAKRDLPFGATSMALLSQLNSDEQKALLPDHFPRYTDKTITDRGHYQARLEQVKQDGYIIESGEYYEGITAVAIPIKSDIPLTFTVVGPDERISATQTMILDELHSVAAEFSQFESDIFR